MRSRIRAIRLIPILLTLVFCACTPDSERTSSLEAIARWEDRRLADTDSLILMIQSPDAHVRRAACRAAGLIGRTDILGELSEALNDPSTSVAVEAATGLGFLGDAEAVAPLSSALAGATPQLRSAILFALSQVPHDGSVFVDYCLGANDQDASLAWNGMRNHAAEADSSLLAETLAAGLGNTNPDVLWRVLRCAELSRSRELVPDILGLTTHTSTQVSVHACRALGRLAVDDEDLTTSALKAADRTWDGTKGDRHRDAMRLRIAVLHMIGSLAGDLFGADNFDAGSPGAQVVAILTDGMRDPDTHVQRTALEITADLVGPVRLPAEAMSRDSLLPLWRIRLLQAAGAQLLRLTEDGTASPTQPEPICRAAAIRACCALRGPGLQQSEFWPAINGDPHPLSRAALWVGMCANVLSPVQVQDWSLSVTTDMPPRLRMAACDALVGAWGRFQTEIPDEGTREGVREHIVAALLRISTGGDAAASNAVIQLGQFPSADVLMRVCDIDDRADMSPVGVDLKFGVLEACRLMFENKAFSVPDSLQARVRLLLETGFDAPLPSLRRAARQAALQTDLVPDTATPSEASLLATLPALRRDPRQAPLTLPFEAPKVRCTTERGDFVIQLDGHIAPNTCATFLALIRQGYYDDLLYHRVVPDFVAQGGCPDGYGWGGPGFNIRSEWSRLSYDRGTVGIAHSGKDTGGSQFFVTLSPQPHLNGRYTIFGKVVSGMKVADSLQPDDSFRLSIEE